ncbi:MAG: mechanosensitive ion channel family protein [Candidatus Promineifilaceae bacterium]|nr:mechanosensitive ion channel family protein [Candidatus Promineifilaceae bacterium]
MELVTQWIEENLNLSISLQGKIFYTLIVLILVWAARLIVVRLLRRRTEDTAVFYRWRKGVEYISLAVGVFLIVMIWINDLGSAATYLGLLSAGLAIALQDPITNFFGWIFIISRHPFEVGDRIEIGDHAGDVVDIRYFQFTMMEIGNWVDADQSTGRVLHVPNRKVFNETLANYSRGFAYIWNEIPVLITFESNWQKTKQILLEIAQRHARDHVEDARERVREAARRYFIHYDNLTPIVYTRVEKSGVLLTVRYLCQPRRRRGSVNRIWEDILNAFDQHEDIALAYPTQRLYYQPPPNEESDSDGDER